MIYADIEDENAHLDEEKGEDVEEASGVVGFQEGLHRVDWYVVHYRRCVSSSVESTLAFWAVHRDNGQ